MIPSQRPVVKSWKLHCRMLRVWDEIFRGSLKQFDVSNWIPFYHGKMLPMNVQIEVTVVLTIYVSVDLNWRKGGGTF